MKRLLKNMADSISCLKKNTALPAVLLAAMALGCAGGQEAPAGRPSIGPADIGSSAVWRPDNRTLERICSSCLEGLFVLVTR